MNVLVLTLSFGSGHVRASQAVAKEIAVQDSNANVRVVDVLTDAHPLFRMFYELPYWLMLRHAPSVWSRLNSARHIKMHESTAPAWAFRLGCQKVFQAIESFRPDVILAIEVAACEISAIARQAKITRAPILSVITDYEAEPIWIKPEVSAFTVADENGRTELIGWGAPADKIFVTGIPIDASFAARYDDEATRLRYGIKDDLPIVLLMGGGMGPTRMDEVARALSETNHPLHVIAIAGRDRRALGRLRKLRVEPPASLRVLGWTDDVPALMQAAQLLVTKPGGLTTLEAAAASLPVVLFDPIPGAEFINAKRMVDAGAALLIHGREQTVSAVLSLLQDKPRRDAMAANAGNFARPNARREIAAIALDLANSSENAVAERARRVA